MKEKKLKFEFGKYTEITDLAFKTNPFYKKEGYVRFFICPDVNDFWFVRISPAYNKKGKYSLDRDNISKYRGEKLTLKRVIEIIDDDNYDSWDSEEGTLDSLIELLDGGYGINNLK